MIDSSFCQPLDADMNEKDTYTLAELAEKCGLTERTTRYYIEKVLPPHHKQGRGKLAQYGHDTLNSIRFIKLVSDNHGIRPGQARDVLARVQQETIDRVVSGEEELAVMTVPSVATKMRMQSTHPLVSASSRVENFKSLQSKRSESEGRILESADFLLDEELAMADSAPEFEERAAFLRQEPEDPWHTIFETHKIRIQTLGARGLSNHQEEQVEAAARLIELALR